jgi:hypothetical protein
MEIYNTISYQKQFEKDVNYGDTTPDIYLTKLLNNYFKSLSIIYKYPYKFKWNSILYDFHLSYKLTDNKKFELNVNKGLLSLDSTLIEINEEFKLTLNDISISNYRFCNILFVVDFDFYKYTLDKENNLPKFKLYLYDSITGILHNPNNDFNISNVIILETYSIYYDKLGHFHIRPYRKRLSLDDVYDKFNYIYENPKPPIIDPPYPNVDNDNPDYTHAHLLTHNHCYGDLHDHNSNINLIQKYYSEKIKISENENPPPIAKNNITILDNSNFDTLDYDYPLLLELFNKCNLEIGDINNLSFDFRHIDPYQDLLNEWYKNRYNYSKLINYNNIDNGYIVINSRVYPIRTENYWLYLLRQYDDWDNINILERYKYLYEDNINNFGCFCL